MSVVTATPDSTVLNTGALTGGATAHEVLGDLSDATYILFDPGELVSVTFDDPTIPAGAVVKAQSVYVRAYAPGGGDPYMRSSFYSDGETNYQSNVLKPGTIKQFSGGVLTGNLDPDTSVYTAQITTSIGLVSTAVLVVTYIAKPVADVLYPTGTLTEDNLPTIFWENTLDPDGGPQYAALVKVFNEDQYTDGGFDPSTSDAVFSTVVNGPAVAVTVADRLIDGNYRAYVLPVQQLNLNADWDYEAFTVDVDVPGNPTFEVTDENGLSRVRLDLESETGETTTTGFEIQRKSGSDWIAVRTLEGVEGVITTAESSYTAYDFEAEPGAQATYRARALHTFASGTVSASEWVEATTPHAISSDSWWVKHPTRPSRNLAIDLRSFQSQGREARQSTFQPLGRTDAVVVSDTRGPETGSITFRLPDDLTRDRLRELASYGEPLLLSPPADHHEPARWVALGGEEISRLVDKSWLDERDATYDWTLVSRPDGALEDWGHLYPSAGLYPAEDLYPH